MEAGFFEFNGSPGATRVVLDPDDVQKLTTHHSTDARTAIALGIAEYLVQCQTVTSGSPVSFKRGYFVWAANEIDAVMPSFAVTSDEAAQYDSGNFAPSLRQDMRIEGTKYYLKIASEIRQVFTVEVWTADIVQRIQLCDMIEQAFNPVDWMGGVRLELPHYYNARCDVDLMSLNYMDSQEDARHELRNAQIRVTATIPVLRLHGPPGAPLASAPGVPGITIPDREGSSLRVVVNADGSFVCRVGVSDGKVVTT